MATELFLLIQYGLYGFVQQNLTEQLILNAGLRYQNHNVYGGEWIPSAGFAWQLNDITTWKGNVSKGFRSPTIRELYMWGEKNQDLNPASVMNYETGISRDFLNRKLHAELTFFIIDGDNLIVSVPVNGVNKFMNTGEVSNKGIEFSLDTEVSRNLMINATYTYINMEQPVFATPEHHLYVGASYRLNKLQFNASIRQVSGLENDPSPAVNKVDYTLLDAKVMYNLARNLRLFVSAENLLDEDYQVNRYYTMPGTTFFGGVNFTF